MLLSIIIPVFNVQNYIEKCVQSLLGVDEKQYEIILINDGSSDLSGEICRCLSHKYSNIKYVNKSNEGVSLTRNVGIKESKGEYLMFVDSDDFLEHNSLNMIIKKLNIYNPDILSFSLKRIYRDGSFKKTKLLFEKEEEIKGNDRIIEKIIPLMIDNRISMPCCIYKKSILINNNILFDNHLHYSEDYLFLLKYFLYCNSFVYLPEYLYNYNIWDNVLSYNYRNMLDSICKEPYCNYIFDILKGFDSFDKKQYKTNQLLNIHMCLYNEYLKNKTKLINTDVCNKLDQLNEEKLVLLECPFKLKVLLLLLLNKHFNLYFFVLDCAKRLGVIK